MPTFLLLAMGYFDQVYSELCWKSATQVKETYKKLKSEAPRLKAVKEQNLIQKLGFG
jgi:hypothetical protein